MLAVTERTRVEKFANLSTGHLTFEVRAALDMYDQDLNLAPSWLAIPCILGRDYGWFVHIPVLGECVDAEEYAEFPQCLRDCFDLARNDGATWILFDCDEPMIGDLPIYED